MYLERVSPSKSAKWSPPPAAEMARIRREAGTAEGVASSDSSAKDGAGLVGVSKGEAMHQEAV